MVECEALERNEQVDNSFNKNKNNGNKQQHKGKEKNGSHPRKDSNNKNLKYCSEHGKNATHDSSKCWVLHPKLKPAKFVTASNQKKELNVLLKETSTKELLNMLLNKKAEEAIPKEKPIPRKKSSNKSVTKCKQDKVLDSSDESIQQMDCETSIPSDGDTTPFNSDIEEEPKVAKKKKQRINKLGEADE